MRLAYLMMYARLLAALTAKQRRALDQAVASYAAYLQLPVELLVS